MQVGTVNKANDVNEEARKKVDEKAIEDCNALYGQHYQGPRAERSHVV